MEKQRKRIDQLFEVGTLIFHAASEMEEKIRGTVRDEGRDQALIQWGTWMTPLIDDEYQALTGKASAKTSDENADCEKCGEPAQEDGFCGLCYAADYLGEDVTDELALAWEDYND